ncbi:hypothetical protein PALI_a2988 [Pseudoalteromonas aliena SW19]|uniref:Uncharacterized protein n=1 Tax=Pseudoalteromonas aliena SW19 TaxID=1314866 RepID=A0ABR9E2T3_9GAMM|nr:hypothetical protein [Pseudoalteromonas aliena SW19]
MFWAGAVLRLPMKQRRADCVVMIQRGGRVGFFALVECYK